MDKSQELAILLQKKQTYEQMLEHINKILETSSTPQYIEEKEKYQKILDFVNTSIAKCSAQVNEAPKPPKVSTNQWSIGDECEALYAEDNMYYPAIISSIDDFTDELHIIYLGYGPATLKPDQVRPLTAPLKDNDPIDPKDLQINAECRVRSIEDGRLYDCIIKDIKGDIVTVQYKRTKEIMTVRKKNIKKKRFNPYEATTLEDAPKILPTDSDRVKKQKKRIIDKIKYQTKQKETEQFFKDKQNSWKNFQKKIEKKKNLHVVPTMKEVKPNTRPF